MQLKLLKKHCHEKTVKSRGVSKLLIQTLMIIAVSVVVLLHIYFLVLEMFLWDTPKGRKVFGLSEEFAKQSKALAANQGLYNGFLAAGLIWGLSLGLEGKPIILFFLICVFVAGVFGGMTVSKKIIWVQAIPALIAFILTYLYYSS